MIVLLRRIARWFSEHSCRHDWDYGPPGATGWGVVRCRNCGETDIYA